MFIKILEKVKNRMIDLSRVSFGDGENYAERIICDSTVYKSYWNRYKNMIRDDLLTASKLTYSLDALESELSSNNKDNSTVFDDTSLLDFFRLTDANSDLNHIIIIIEIHTYYRLYKMNPYKSKDLKSLNSFNDYIKNETNYWFRGQSNYKWNIIPSSLRKLESNIGYNYEFLINDLNCGNTNNKNIQDELKKMDIDVYDQQYGTLAFLQHSISYSPLVDFTKDKNVSLTFSMEDDENSNVRSTLIALDISNIPILEDDNEINQLIKDFKIEVISNRSILNLITNNMWNNFLDNSTFSTIHLIDKPTNDRMIFQKGTFVLFNNTIKISNEMFFNFKSEKENYHPFTYFIADNNNITKIIKKLQKTNPQYSKYFLLNPYIYYLKNFSR